MSPDLPATPPLLGRSRELGVLTDLLGVATQPRSRCVLLAGDAGVGKTRLLTELLQRAEGAGWRGLVGHCLDFGDSALPYLPFTELFGRLAGADPDLAAEIAAGHPAVRHLQPGRRLLADSAAANGDGVDRPELFDAVHAAFERLGASAPLLVVVEDVHWADRSTRDLLRFLLVRGFTSPVAVVASYRSDDLHRRHPLRAAAAEWARLPTVHRMQLGPLPDQAVRALVRGLHPGPLPESEVHAIVSRAEGNAFFAEELVRAVESGGGVLPEDLAELLLVRLDQLDDAAAQVVRAAACAGRRVSHDLLAAVVDLEPERLEEALRAAVEHNVLVPTAGSGYAFRHALLAEAVYDDLLPGERVRLHSAYADALGGRRVEGTAAELARHARAAHDLSAAISASVAAGDEAMAVGGPAEAARHFEVALELLSDPHGPAAGSPDVDPVTLTVKAADAVLAAGSPHRAHALLRDRLAGLSGDAPPEDRALLLMKLAVASLSSDSEPVALDATTEALGLLASGASPLRARVMAVHARACYDRGRDDEAVRWAVEAAQLGEQLGLSRVVADATTTLAKLEERAGNPEKSRRVMEGIVERARADGDHRTELRGVYHLGGLRFEAGDLPGAVALYVEAAELGRRSGRPWAPYALDARLLAAVTAYITGQWDLVSEIVDVAGQDPPEMAEAGLASLGLAVAAGRGRTAALDLLPAVWPWWRRDGFFAVHGGGAAVDLYGDGGDLEGACRVHDEVVSAVTSLWGTEFFLARLRLSALLLGQIGTHVGRLPSHQRSGHLASAEQLVDAAHRALAGAERRSRPLGPEGLAWQARVHAEHLRVTWLAGDRGADEGALRSAWEQAVRRFDAFGHVFETARSTARLAAVLRASGEPDEARRLAARAREVAARLGAEPLLAELRVLGGPGYVERAASRAATPQALTPRELEILALVAQGRSNGAIARQLFISAKTVSVHVSNILAKLGASGRTEAAALARAQGLVPD